MAAGKAIAEKTKKAREAQKKAAAEAAVIIANNKAKETPASHVPPAVEDTNLLKEQNTSRNVLTTTQWLSVASSFGFSDWALLQTRQTPPDSSSQPLLEATSPEMQRPPPQPKKGIRPMD